MPKKIVSKKGKVSKTAAAVAKKASKASKAGKSKPSKKPKSKLMKLKAPSKPKKPKAKSKAPVKPKKPKMKLTAPKAKGKPKKAKVKLPKSKKPGKKTRASSKRRIESYNVGPEAKKDKLTYEVFSKRSELLASRDAVAKKFGRVIRDEILSSGKLPDSILVKKTWKDGVLEKMVDSKLRRPKNDKQMNSAYRGAAKAHDELFSTAQTRELLKGIFSPYKNGSIMKDEVFKLLKDTFDVASSARIETKFSGFALKNWKMQHPTSLETKFFGNPRETASEHSFLDKERKDYVEQAMNRAIKDKKGGVEIVKEGVKAAIEFTLNYFTAPITAKDVLPFTYLGNEGHKWNSEALQEQLQSRERMKDLYVKLGGNLRSLKGTETQKQSIQRPWNPQFSDNDRPFIMPPSPERNPMGFETGDIEMKPMSLI